ALLAETRRIAERRGCAVWSARGAETLRSVPFRCGGLPAAPAPANSAMADALRRAGLLDPKKR
ncbi:hypothetical protein ABZT16_42205, partial [Streptomyces flaveolus]|uniref:hypothetical protein n=1 Tax=Streptomyces flaveolus TaxID=67297 RepID=UPI0033B9522D